MTRRDNLKKLFEKASYELTDDDFNLIALSAQEEDKYYENWKKARKREKNKVEKADHSFKSEKGFSDD